MRRIPNDPAGGWLLNGVWYDTEGEYLAALRRRDERRRRVMALMEAREEWEAAHPEVAWHGLEAGDH
jgi:hypothetical protein